MSSHLDQWLEREGVARWGILESHTKVLKTLLQDKTTAQDAAKELVDTATLSPDPSDTAYRLWNLLFHTAAAFPAHIDHVVRLTLAIRRIPPSPESPNTLSYSLWSHWQDTHSYYYTWRTLRPSSPGSLMGAEHWINFTAFSAELIHHGDEKAMREIGITAFFDLRDALETTLETRARDLSKNAVVTADQSLQTDTIAAAQWVMHAGCQLMQVQNHFFGNRWTKGLSKKTELWDGEPGFSRARWKFWAERFGERAKDVEAREMVKEAACVIRANLGEST
ncbi:hypothetical protein M436DRAFT_86632 [Aureobasidium namibiae CBS 147.97]|uniref:Uncharacterized protein n=1 Tax=Aureobasidium namibiae CBS 147.97 TaxID=1043004 RepID=A0A074W975_9PEZI